MIVSSDELQALYDLAKEVAEKAKAEDDTGRKAWNTIVCLDRALYDLWGAFGYTALAEEGKGNP